MNRLTRAVGFMIFLVIGCAIIAVIIAASPTLTRTIEERGWSVDSWQLPRLELQEETEPLCLWGKDTTFLSGEEISVEAPLLGQTCLRCRGDNGNWAPVLCPSRGEDNG